MKRDWFARHGVAIGIGFIVAWAAIVLVSGLGFNITGIAWDFERTGQLGDSFGVLSAIMAAIAAYFAFKTYRAARDDIDRLERRAAEPAFFTLLERRYDVLDRVRIRHIRIAGPDTRTTELEGQRAIDHIAARLRQMPAITANAYAAETDDVSGLSNLYRFIYHVIAFADRQFSSVEAARPIAKDDRAYPYIRLLRAQMSDSELLLVALNCVYGEGRAKFKPLAERYALLHNMNRGDIDRLGLRRLFAPTAFGIEPADRIAGSDGASPS